MNTHDETEIRAVIEARAQAIRAKDASGLALHFAGDNVRFDVAHPLQTDTSLGENAEEWFGTWDGPIGYEIRDLRITAGGDVAFATSLNRISGQKTDGEQPSVWVRGTLGLRKIDGRWRIAHEHESVPFYMDGSDKAAVDLQP